ncbi:DUF2508 family protein [Cohnella lupini]|uniref:Uncharacterized protein DUF2508 n=1 Tax=Cohnella lupini TaxID=1294267 RepID=A0A3D9I030_9BACL|nr:DUF2508 family protein [Cohnella lupini]RED54991.1 uncharacterized protein DUF2508 [Cohnella lupini]
MQRKSKSGLASVHTIERQRLIADIRKAEQEWNLAEWRFHHALGEDHVDYAIYCLEAAEKKLGMLLRQAKWQWSNPGPIQGGEVTG